MSNERTQMLLQTPPCAAASVASLTLPAKAKTQDFVVVDIGASAGGLEACRRPWAQIPASSGIPLPDSSQTIAFPGGRCAKVSKSAQLFRCIGHDRPGECGLAVHSGDLDRAPRHVAVPSRQSALADLVRINELERELATTRADLQSANRILELSRQEQKAIIREALSVKKAFQSANTALLASKEELQSLNEELTALNSQLQETVKGQRTSANEWNAIAAARVLGLTARQHEIMDLVLAGHPSKNIAADLGISQRTVETHRASIMKKTASASLPALARLALAAQSGVAAHFILIPPTRAPDECNHVIVRALPGRVGKDGRLLARSQLSVGRANLSL